MAHDPKRVAVEALFLTLADKLPAVLVARDALRSAVRRSKLGPFTIPANAVITINGEQVALTAGSRTAAQVVADIAAAPPDYWTATVETDGSGSRLLFALAGGHEGGPTRENPSVLRFEGEEATLAALGLRPIISDVAEECVSDPLPTLSEGEPGEIVQIDRPLIFCSESVSGPYRNGSLRQRLHVVTITLECWLPGSPNLPVAATLNKAFEMERAICAVLRTGDSRAPFYVGGSTVGAHVVQAKPVAMTARTQVFQFRGAGATIPVAVCRPAIEVLVASSET